MAANESEIRKKKNDMWALSVDAWKEAAVVTDFMQEAIAGLQDADGDPLPDVAKQFFIDLFFLKAKTKGKTHKYLPKEQIRDLYNFWLFMEQQATQHTRKKGESPSDFVKEKLAMEYKTTVPIIDQIVSPRKSRMSRKPRKA